MNHATDHIIAALRAAREQKAISQRELSARSGVPQAKISRLENGAVDVQLSSLVSLARALDLEVELVPRKALPAIETIVRSTERKEVANTSTNEVRRLAKALQGIHVPEISPAVLEKAQSQLRMIERFQLSPEVMQSIQRFNDYLAKTKLPDIDFEKFNRHAKAIEHLRNQLAHTPPPALPPKPAYNLDDEEEDNNA
jgi:transcriptional regulator with XRE-family HTH domain